MHGLRCAAAASQGRLGRIPLKQGRETTWSSYREFLVESVVSESESTKSFYLVPADGGPLAPYLPGQHLPIRILPQDGPRPIIRCYTLSDAYDGRRYRLTIKRQGTPPGRPDLSPGVSSGYFHDKIKAGDSIQARMPNGRFYLDLSQDHPVTLIAGGIGVTPMISMLNAACGLGSTREINFLFALRHRGDHVFRDHLWQLKSRHSNLRMHVLYEQPCLGDQQGRDFDSVGRIDAALLRGIVANARMEYFLCGPPAMMESVIQLLQEMGVGETRLRTESFGPSSLSMRAAMVDEQTSPETDIQVTFERSGITVPWTKESGTLLELAEAHGVEIEFGCRYGDCATCLIPLISGKVAYLHPTGAVPEQGTCLPCSCTPLTDVILGS